MANKRKVTTAVVAGVTAVALLLGGTFAWTSISQTAKNEAIVDINPGGRLHDDFDGKNKDVYVENFSSGATGVNIYARIRLDQYFEVGQDAGINKEAADRKADVKIGEDINDVNTWETYIPTVDEEGNIDLSNPVQANDNWQWNLGNDDSNLPYYMPTFNKNKDSLKADINGTYEGTTEGDIVHYDDFVKYGTNTDANEVASLTKDAIYDWDDDTAEDYETETREETDPIDSADVLKKEETHNATQISTTATVISMAQWLENPVAGNFWVYDTDGWAYWAQPIAPEATTGLLLDSITMSRVPDDNWYYGINVVGQFATASDWEMFFAPEADGGAGEDQMTDGAKQLMALITETAPTEDENPDEPQDDGTLTLNAANSDTVWTTHGVPIPVEFVTDGLDTEAEDYVEPDISEIVVYIEGGAEDGSDLPLEKDTQYTYTYDEGTQTGTLTITDTALEGYIHVTDKEGVVEGDVEVTAENSETYQELILDADGTNSVDAKIDEGIQVTTEDEAADLSSVQVYYWVSEAEGEATESYLTEEQYTYEDGILTITDASLEATTAQLTVEDANNTVSGTINLDYTHDVDADYISIGTVPMQDGYDGTNTVYGTEGYMKPGDYMQLVAAATVNGEYNSDIIASDEDVWTVTGATSTSTTVDDNGKLTIGDDEDTSLHLITVKVTYRGLEATESYYVSGGLTATITEVNNAESYTTGTGYQFTYSILDYDGSDVTNQFTNWDWSVCEVRDDGYSYGTNTATIDEDGNFTATAAGTYEISASADNYYGPDLRIIVTDAAA